MDHSMESIWTIPWNPYGLIHGIHGGYAYIPYGIHDVHGTMNWLWSQPTLIPWVPGGFHMDYTREGKDLKRSECIISEWVPPSIGFAPLSTLSCHPLLHHLQSDLGIPAWIHLSPHCLLDSPHCVVSMLTLLTENYKLAHFDSKRPCILCSTLLSLW